MKAKTIFHLISYNLKTLGGSTIIAKEVINKFNATSLISKHFSLKCSFKSEKQVND